MTHSEDPMECPKCGGRLGDCACAAEIAEGAAEPGDGIVEHKDVGAGEPSEAATGDELSLDEEDALSMEAPDEGENHKSVSEDAGSAGGADDGDEEPALDDPSDMPIDMVGDDEPDEEQDDEAGSSEDDDEAESVEAEDEPILHGIKADDEGQESKGDKAASGDASLTDGAGGADPQLLKGRTEPETRFINSMQALGKQPTVAMFGFKTAGKTWLLHRLRHYLWSEKGGNFDPDFEPVPAEGTTLPGTNEVEFHEHVTVPKWSIIDSPGEFTRQLIAGNVEEMWQLVKVLDRAKAIIVTLPADTLVFGPLIDRVKVMTPEEREEIAREACGPEATDDEIKEIESFILDLRKDYEDIERFAIGLYKAAAALSYVRHKNIDALDKAQYADVTWANVKSHCGDAEAFEPIGGPDGLECPVFVALTRADRVASVLYGDNEIPNAGEIINMRKQDMRTWPQTKALEILARDRGLLKDADRFPMERPSEFVRNLAPELHTRLVMFCPMSRFDIVSAFFGHNYTTKLEFGHYRLCPQWGVDHMFQWIHRALGLSKTSGKRQRRQVVAREIHFAIHGVPSPGDAGLPGDD